MSGSFVYLIQVASTSYYKIGRCIGSPEKRLKDLQIANPMLLILRSSRPGGSSLERALHIHFHTQHVRGEWYDLGNNYVRAVNDFEAWNDVMRKSDREHYDAYRLKYWGRLKRNPAKSHFASEVGL